MMTKLLEKCDDMAILISLVLFCYENVLGKQEKWSFKDDFLKEIQFIGKFL
jgi:hypothetical protein